MFLKLGFDDQLGTALLRNTVQVTQLWQKPVLTSSVAVTGISRTTLYNTANLYNSQHFIQMVRFNISSKIKYEKYIYIYVYLHLL